MDIAPGILSDLDDALALAGSLSGAGERSAQIDSIERLRALQAACGAALARVSAAFVVDRVAESQARNESVEKQQRSSICELALAHQCSPASMSRQHSAYRRLVHDLPEVLRVLASGETSEYTALSVAKAAHSLTADDAARLDREISPQLAGLTTRQAEGRTVRFCQQVDPETAVRRLQKSEREAHVSCRPVADGMARVSILAPTANAVGMYAALRRDAMANPEADLTQGQVMSKLAFQRVTGLDSAADMAIEIQLVMSADTLISLPGHRVGEPARITDTAGSIPEVWLPASVARDLALGVNDSEAARWIRRLFTDPVTGTLAEVDATRRLFSTAMSRHIRLRDQVCTTPWCDAPIRHIDHAVPHAEGGPTDRVNGNGKCERCNYVKEHPGWQTRPVDIGGTIPTTFAERRGIALTTPSGKRYTSTSPPVLGVPPKRRHRAKAPRIAVEVDLLWAS